MRMCIRAKVNKVLGFSQMESARFKYLPRHGLFDSYLITTHMVSLWSQIWSMLTLFLPAHLPREHESTFDCLYTWDWGALRCPKTTGQG